MAKRFIMTKEQFIHTYIKGNEDKLQGKTPEQMFEIYTFYVKNGLLSRYDRFNPFDYVLDSKKVYGKRYK